MAIIYSGNFYMNLDVKTPAERIKNILELIQPAADITNNQFEEKYKKREFQLGSDRLTGSGDMG